MVCTVPYFGFVILKKLLGAVDDSMSQPQAVQLVRLLAFKRDKTNKKQLDNAELWTGCDGQVDD